MSNETYILNGWPVSPYTAKVRSYMRYKSIPFVDNIPAVHELVGKISKTVGKPIMPTVETPTGRWWQDSCDIMDNFEELFPANPIVPSTPRQQVVAKLLEFHADEWLIMAALWYRWKIPANAKWAIEQFGDHGLPGAPRILKNFIANKLATPMQAYLPMLGLTSTTGPGLESYTTTLLARLDMHFASHAYILGGAVSVADFALFGTIWAHLYRDQYSRFLFDDTPNLRAWIDRILAGSPPDGEWLDDDQIATTIEPILQTVFEEHMQFTTSVVAAVDEYCAANPDAKRVPRAFGSAPFTIGGIPGEHRVITFMYFKLQRPLDALNNVPLAQRTLVIKWLNELGGTNFTSATISHPMKRENFKEVLA